MPELKAFRREPDAKAHSTFDEEEWIALSASPFLPLYYSTAGKVYSTVSWPAGSILNTTPQPNVHGSVKSPPALVVPVEVACRVEDHTCQRVSPIGPAREVVQHR
jgi:hypothetical protein